MFPRQTRQILYVPYGCRGAGGAPEAGVFARIWSSMPDRGNHFAPDCHDGAHVRRPDTGQLSFWLDTVPGSLAPGEPLPGDIEADVAIVGAGLTGLWTAYYLARQPGLRIAVCEREIAGFGASGRNGGWCSALFPASLAKLARMAGRDGAIAMQRAMQDTVDEVGRVAAAPRASTATLPRAALCMLARSPAQLERAQAEVDEAREFGFGEEDLRLLSARGGQRDGGSDASARRHLHAALRRHPPGAAGPRPGRCGGADAVGVAV